MLNAISVIIVTLLSSFAFAGTFYDVTLPDEVTIDGKKKVLNGMALRKVRKFGIPVKVYVGGLYLDEKSQDSEAILNELNGNKRHYPSIHLSSCHFSRGHST